MTDQQVSTGYVTTVIFNVEAREPLHVLDFQISPQRNAPKTPRKKNLFEYVTTLTEGGRSVRLAVQSDLPDAQAVVSWKETWSEPRDFTAEGERHERVCQALEGAIQLATGIPVQVNRWFVTDEAPIDAYVEPPLWPRGQGRTPAILSTEHVPLLEDVMTILRGGHARKLEIGLLEYASALHAYDIRREFIHGVIALEALFGDSESEATSFKVPLRASLFLPSFEGRAREGFDLIRTFYGIRSKFVHGSWDEKILRRAEENVGLLRSVVREALLESTRWVKSGRVLETVSIDDEVLFKR